MLWAAEWDKPSFDFWSFDARMDELAEQAGNGPFLLYIGSDLERMPGLVLEVLTRCQRLAGRRNAASACAAFDGILERHRALHDLGKPLVLADYRHALDVWQWVLRLEPEAGLAVQLAALFHDVERLASEAEERIEHRAADYRAFKGEHARTGAALTEKILAGLPLGGIDPETRRQAARLVAAHERPPSPGDPDAADLALLNEADALSFFSLNSSGYWDYYGPEATRRKVAYTLERLRPEGRRRLRQMRLRPQVERILAS